MSHPYIAIPLGTFAFALLFCVVGTLRDTGGAMPYASTLAMDLLLAYAAGSLTAIGMFLFDFYAHPREPR